MSKKRRENEIPSRSIRHNAISYWLLIVVFCGLAAYLVFPNTLDGLAFRVFPSEKGIPRAHISFTVSGNTFYPGIASLNITVVNNDVMTHDYAILAAIGNAANGWWWGPGYYKDGMAPSTDVQKIPAPWYTQAFICTGPLKPGQSFHVTRKIEIQDDSRIKDALVIVCDKTDATKELARDVQLNVINS
jgi:hypothetical protein